MRASTLGFPHTPACPQGPPNRDTTAQADQPRPQPPRLVPTWDSRAAGYAAFHSHTPLPRFTARSKCSNSSCRCRSPALGSGLAGTAAAPRGSQLLLAHVVSGHFQEHTSSDIIDTLCAMSLHDVAARFIIPGFRGCQEPSPHTAARPGQPFGTGCP